MPQFSYVAHSKKGNVQKGSLVAKDQADLARLLREQELLLVTASQGKQRRFGKNMKIPGLSGVKMIERVLFTRHLQIMIKAGLSITRSLEIITEQTENTILKGIIQDVKQRVEQGQTLTESLARHPKVFSPLYTSMIEVGELGGTLEQVLDDLATQLKKDYELRAKVRGAMLYPAVIFSVMTVVIVLMLVYVLPQLVEIFREVEGELPITTRALIWTSDFIQNFGIYLLILFVAMIIAAIAYHRSPSGRRVFHWIFLRFPILGAVIQKMNLARFSRTTSILLHSDISIVKTLSIVAHVVGNVWYQDLMNDASKRVKKGVSISESISTEKARKLFPPVVRQMVSVGEQTGTLDSVLGDLAEFYEKDVTQTTDNLSSVIEPILMVALGIGVAIIAISVISPIYSLVETF